MGWFILPRFAVCAGEGGARAGLKFGVPPSPGPGAGTVTASPRFVTVSSVGEGGHPACRQGCGGASGGFTAETLLEHKIMKSEVGPALPELWGSTQSELSAGGDAVK